MANFNNMGGLVLPGAQPWGGGYNSPMPQPQPQQQVNTNKVYVTDANDAMTRMAPFNSLIMYIQQDETMIHEIYTDGQGRKQIRSRALTDPTPVPVNEPAKEDLVSRKEFDELKAMVDKLKEGMTT